MVMSENKRHKTSRGPSSRASFFIALLCWMALAQTIQAQETRFMNAARNRTSQVRITTDPIPLDAKVDDDSSNNIAQMKRSLEGEATTGTTTTTWFRIESTSNPNQCVAVLNGNTEYDTLIHTTNCDDSDKTLWTQSTDNYYVRSKLNPKKCIVTTGRFLMLKNCPDYSSRRTQEGAKQVRSTVTLPTEAAFEAYDDDTIRQISSPNKCWQLHEVHHGMIELATCGSSERQHWSATTVLDNIAEVKQAVKEADLKVRGFDDWYTIQSKSSSKCIAVEGGEALKLAPIVLVDCDASDETQLWTHSSSRATEDPDHTKIGMIRSKLNPDMCLVPSGSANAHVPLILWYCDPQEEFGSWTVFDEDSSIRSTHDAQVCLDTYEYDSEEQGEFQHDVIVGTCPEDGESLIEDGQQWTFLSVAQAKALAAKEEEEDDDDWTTIKSKASGNCLTVEGGEALKLAPIVLKPCELQDASQLWTHSSSRATENPDHTKIGMIRSKLNPGMCLVPSGSADANVPLVLWNCDPQEEFGSWTVYEEDSTIRSTHDAQVCLDTYEYDSEEQGEFQHDVIVGTCPDDGESLIEDGQQWTFLSVAQAKVLAAKEEEDKEWMTIKSKASGNCLTVEGGEALKLAPIVLKPCELQDASQLWEHNSERLTETPSHVKIGMIRSKLNPDMCLVPSGSADANVPLVLWNCDPQEDFGCWTMYLDDSSIRTTSDPTVCLDTHELDSDGEDEGEDEFKHDVIIGTCPEGDSMPSNPLPSQQWETTVV